MQNSSLADQRRGFQIHAFVFVVGMLGLFITNYFATPTYWWAFWSLLGWGIGLMAHWWFVLGPGASQGAMDKQD